MENKTKNENKYEYEKKEIQFSYASLNLVVSVTEKINFFEAATKQTK